jgi:hypothetical protein
MQYSENNCKTSNNSNFMQGKNKIVKNQLQTIFEYLSKNIATATMVSDATGVPQKNICRYKKDLENRGLLMEIVKKNCEVTGFKAYYITTDTTKFTKPLYQQTKLF